MKLTAGLRYNNDKKSVRARAVLASSNGNIFAPYGFSGDLFDTPIGADFDGDSATECTAASPVGPVGSVPGCEPFQSRSISYNKLTGRAVIDLKINNDNPICAYYSGGYTTGGLTPPLPPVSRGRWENVGAGEKSARKGGHRWRHEE